LSQHGPSSHAFNFATAKEYPIPKDWASTYEKLVCLGGLASIWLIRNSTNHFIAAMWARRRIVVSIFKECRSCWTAHRRNYTTGQGVSEIMRGLACSELNRQ
jgi:hypothetical protein